ncbi:MAG: gamma-glutamyltransferase, partial [Candidatus Thorarchaeota archaeon]|nr:gamma-glutamyltransferase [Candidatus Thorarchaeota archaeon]
FETTEELRLLSLHGEGEAKRKSNRMGHRAVAVPGTLAGLSLALDEYGSLELRELIHPAIRAAKEGFPVNHFMSSITREDWNDSLSKLRNFPLLSKTFLKANKPYQPGEIMVRKDLAQTYEKIARKGCDVFYRGEIAEFLAKEMEQNGGLITEKDMENYKPILR